MRLLMVGEKGGTLGTVLAAMGCATCFPALGGLAAAMGLGFLARFEGLFLNTLLPLFATLVLLMHVVAGLGHRCWHRMVLGLVGPGMVLATLYPFWTQGWSIWMFYTGVVLTLAVSMLDLVVPPRPRCVHGSRECGMPPREGGQER